MRAIRDKNTKPEMIVRTMAHRLGYRYRVHQSGLPGKPDLVFAGRRKAIFVHGCFWHQHPTATCSDSRAPRSNTAYWGAKLARNVERDAQHSAALQAEGWRVLTIWDCETKDLPRLKRRLARFLD